jgi:hypothetical protein
VLGRRKTRIFPLWSSTSDSESSVLGACGQLVAWTGMDSGTVCGALSGKSPVKSESLARGGVMTMTLCGSLVAVLLVCLCLVWVARLAVVVCPIWSCHTTTLVHCAGFQPVPLQMNRSILFCFFNKMRQNCPFCSKKKSSRGAQACRDGMAGRPWIVLF